MSRQFSLIHLDDVMKWKHFSPYWPFVRGIHRSPMDSPHNGQWRGALMFSLIWIWINDWVNIRGLVIWDAIAPSMTSLSREGSVPSFCRVSLLKFVNTKTFILQCHILSRHLTIACRWPFWNIKYSSCLLAYVRCDGLIGISALRVPNSKIPFCFFQYAVSFHLSLFFDSIITNT